MRQSLLLRKVWSVAGSWTAPQRATRVSPSSYLIKEGASQRQRTQANAPQGADLSVWLSSSPRARSRYGCRLTLKTWRVWQEDDWDETLRSKSKSVSKGESPRVEAGQVGEREGQAGEQASLRPPFLLRPQVKSGRGISFV